MDVSGRDVVVLIHVYEDRSPSRHLLRSVRLPLATVREHILNRGSREHALVVDRDLGEIDRFGLQGFRRRTVALAINPMTGGAIGLEYARAV